MTATAIRAEVCREGHGEGRAAWLYPPGHRLVRHRAKTRSRGRVRTELSHFFRSFPHEHRDEYTATTATTTTPDEQRALSPPPSAPARQLCPRRRGLRGYGCGERRRRTALSFFISDLLHLFSRYMMAASPRRRTRGPAAPYPGAAQVYQLPATVPGQSAEAASRRQSPGCPAWRCT